MDKAQELAKAIDDWNAVAQDEISYPNAVLRESAARTVQALEIERDTGVAVCLCCLKPLRTGCCLKPYGT